MCFVGNKNKVAPSSRILICLLRGLFTTECVFADILMCVAQTVVDLSASLISC